MECDVKMLSAEHGFGIRDEYDGLCIIDNHRWPRDGITNPEFVKQEHRCIRNAAYPVKVDRMRGVSSGRIFRALFQRLELFED